MRKQPSRNRPADAEEPARRPRTVLLALHWNDDRLKGGIVRYARQRRWHLLDLRYYLMELPRSFHPDGVLFSMPASRRSLARQLVCLGAPVVQIQDYVLNVGAGCVVHDRVALGRLAADHFLARGFRNLAYLRHKPWGHPNAKQTCQGFVDRAAEAGVQAYAFWLQRKGPPVHWDQFATYLARFAEEMAEVSFPLGILAYNDVMAVRVCHMCAELGLLVPEQVAVMGIGNDPLHCECGPVPLSSVDPDTEGQGWLAAKLLGELMSGQAPPDEPVLVAPKAVARRKSTDIFAMQHVDVAQALRYLWDHFAEPLTVAAVAEAVGVSRRKLERHFLAQLGRTVNQELTRKRLERCCELLATTDETIAAIARQVGYPTSSYLYRVFRAAFGQTPRQYRLASRGRP